MKTLVFLDTNFIYSNKSKFDLIGKLNERNIELFTSELVINELKGKHKRKIKEAHSNLTSFMNKAKYYIDYQYINVNFTDETNLNESYAESSKNIDGFFKRYFTKNLIPFQNHKEMMSILLERNMNKIAPFTDGDSDRGFMDTLIWISFINFCKESNYNDYIFVTNDDDFNKQSETLIKEFRLKVPNRNIQIQKIKKAEDLLQLFDIVNDSKNSKKDLIEEKAENDIPGDLNVSDELISNIQDVVDSIMLSEPDWNGMQSYNFRFEKKFELNDVENFCNELMKIQHIFIFMKHVDLSEVFTSIGFNSKIIEKVEIKAINQFIEIWKKIRGEDIKIKEAFLELVKSLLNNMVHQHQDNPFSIELDDLPF